MSKKLVTSVLLLVGAAMAANCGGDSNTPAGGESGMGTGGSGDPGEAGSGGTNTAGKSGGGTDAGGMAGELATGGTGEIPVGGSSEGGSSEGGAGGVPATNCPSAIGDYLTVYAEAICAKRVECCTDDNATCMTEVTAALQKIFPDLAAAEQAGSAEGNCTALAACAGAIAAAECSEFPKEIGTLYGIAVDEPLCRGVIKGKLQPSAGCTSHFQCLNGYCTGPSNEPKTCTAFVLDFGACDNSNLCNTGTSYCAADSKCAPRLADGQSCTNASQCESRLCDTADTGKCVAPGAAECKYVPKGCSISSSRPVRDSAGWAFVAVGLALTAGVRRRRR